MAVTYVDDTAEEGREVNGTYVSHDGGNSWQAVEAVRQADLLSTTDGGKSFRVISPPASSVPTH
jgi:hypothetical protein